MAKFSVHADKVNDNELYYEIVISKGKGKLTPRAEKMLILIAEKLIKTQERKFKNSDDRNDSFQQGILMVFQNWRLFNEKKYKKAFPYFTEVCKRGFANGYNEVMNKKTNKDSIKTISIESSNNGFGLHNI